MSAPTPPWKLKAWTEKWAHLWPSASDWKAYEAYVTGTLERRFPAAKIRKDTRLPGKKSGVLRQIDILVEQPERIAFDCKRYKRKVHVKHVETFLGMLDDLGIGSGVLVTTHGYTAAAQERAKNDARSIDLQILAPERLSEYQHVGAPLIWRDSFGFFLVCPEGWVSDTERTGTGSWSVAMYPLGHTLQSAARAASFIYANILLNKEGASLETHAARHEADILADAPNSTFERTHLVIADDKGVGHDALLRTAKVEAMPFGLEHSLYTNYGESILLLVGLSPPELKGEMIARLKDIAAKTFTMIVDDKRSKLGQDMASS